MRRQPARAGAAALTVALTTAGLLLSGAGPAGATPGPANAPEYWFDAWQLTQLWGQGANGTGITIAEIDTGVNASLPELAANIVPGKDFGVPGNGEVDREVNSFGHGTAMASIMVAQPGILGITGIAPDAKVMPIAIPLTGTSDEAGNDHLADAIRWAADHGAKVISMSLGGPREPAADPTPCPDDEQAAIFYALSKGDVLLASAGNDGPTTNTVEEPGVCLGVISVGAVDQNDVVADFSSRHPYLTLTAPGVNIPSLSRVAGSAFRGDGTSQATAIASAVVALVWSRYPHLSGSQLVARILATLDRHTTTRDPAYGYGIINAYTAVTATVAASTPDPVYAAADPFLARLAAFSATSAGVPAPAPSDGNTGSFSVGHSPRLLVPRVLEGIGVGSAGLLALLALVVLGILRRRSRSAGPPPGPAGAGPPGAGPAVPATAAETSGMVWHDIIEPPADSAWFA